MKKLLAVLLAVCIALSVGLCVFAGGDGGHVTNEKELEEYRELYFSNQWRIDGLRRFFLYVDDKELSKNMRGGKNMEALRSTLDGAYYYNLKNIDELYALLDEYVNGTYISHAKSYLDADSSLYLLKHIELEWRLCQAYLDTYCTTCDNEYVCAGVYYDECIGKYKGCDSSVINAGLNANPTAKTAYEAFKTDSWTIPAYYDDNFSVVQATTKLNTLIVQCKALIDMINDTNPRFKPPQSSMPNPTWPTTTKPATTTTTTTKPATTTTTKPAATTATTATTMTTTKPATPPPRTIGNTSYVSTPWNWFMYVFFLGFLWMR